jgi:TPR repeat protein
LQLKAAAYLGHGDSQSVSGCCLYFGTAGEKDFAEAAKYFKLSADQRNSYGEVRNRRALEFGEGVARDLTRAVDFSRRSSEQGRRCWKGCSGGSWK